MTAWSYSSRDTNPWSTSARAPFELDVGVVAFGAVTGELGLRLAQGGLEGPWVDGEKEGAGGDALALAEVDLGDRAFDLGAQGDGGHGLDRADRPQLEGDVLPGDAGDDDGDGYRVALCGAALASGRRGGATPGAAA